MNYFGSKIFSLLLFVFFAVVPVSAALQNDTVHSLREVVVTEKHADRNLRATAPLQQLDNESLKTLSALQISDAVKHFSGVTVKDYGGIGGLKTISVRSLGAQHTAVSYDGIALSDMQTGQIDIGRFSLDNVDLLTLSNGQSDQIFQPARLFASAAVLDIRTLSPQFSPNKKQNGKASLKMGSFGLVNPTLLYQQQFSKVWAATLSAEYLYAHGEYPYLMHHSYLGTGTTSIEKRKNSDVRNARAEAALHARFSDKQSGYLKLYYYDSERGLPGGTILYNEGAFTSQRMWDNTFFVQTHYKNEFSAKAALQFNAKYNRGFLHYLDTVVHNSVGFEESFFTQNELYASLSALYRPIRRLSFSLASDASVNTMFAKFENTHLTNNFAKPLRYSLLTVLAAKYTDEHLIATASLLSTNIVEKVQVGDAAKNRNRFSPYVSLSVKPFESNNLRLRAFYKNIFRMPTFNDLYYARIGNANLRPETTDQFNLGLTYHHYFSETLPHISITADAYRNHVQDKIVAMPTKNLFKWTMLNLGKVDVTGLDLTFEAKVQVIENIFLSAGSTYTYQRAIDTTQEGGSTYGHQIPYTPRTSGSGRVAVETPWVNLAYALLWSGKRYALLQNYSENRLPGYSDHSISASHDFLLKAKTVTANVELLNLLNENYAIVKWFPMPGRSVRGTISLKF